MYWMMSRCWLQADPTLQIEASKTSVWGSFSMIENKPLPISLASAICGPKLTGSLYCSTEINPGEPVPMPSCTGPADFTKANVKSWSPWRTTTCYHLSMIPALPPNPVVLVSSCPATLEAGLVGGVNGTPAGNIAGKLSGGVVVTSPE